MKKKLLVCLPIMAIVATGCFAIPLMTSCGDNPYFSNKKITNAIELTPGKIDCENIIDDGKTVTINSSIEANKPDAFYKSFLAMTFSVDNISNFRHSPKNGGMSITYSISITYKNNKNDYSSIINDQCLEWETDKKDFTFTTPDCVMLALRMFSVMDDMSAVSFSLDFNGGTDDAIRSDLVHFSVVYDWTEAKPISYSK